ncbi:related to TOB3 (member of AAA-ATPase family) [Phialocephala subalpina]|uniref:Related to TOB3 (Member of AAA-ATPase family) n=1 Tax=Phialocephala subalpina TaxID=576137 RepID=A0A1L7WEE9_9HELO|nr:related to TOB3 (member of AAA-ATPase family) [Phialocephala subalpina]
MSNPAINKKISAFPENGDESEDVITSRVNDGGEKDSTEQKSDEKRKVVEGKEKEKEKTEATRIARYDDIFDYRSYQRKLVKSAKPKKKTDNKKPILIVRRYFDYKNRHTSTTVDIKSKGLVDVLIDCNDDVEGLGLNQNPPSADPSLFYHSRQALIDRLATEHEKESSTQDEILVADLKTALLFTEEEHGAAIADMSTLLPAEECTWDLLWALFKPSSLVFHFHKYTQQPSLLLFRCVHSGVRFGLARYPEKIEIDQFEGARKIGDLDVVPLQFMERESELRSFLGERGRRYAALKKSYWEVSGLAVREERNPNLEWATKRFSFSAYGRVMIDSAAFNTHNPDCEYMASVHTAVDRDKLTDDQYLICLPYAVGFSFGNKRWGGFAVSKLEPITWGTESFRSLVMEPKRKKLIHSLVKQHTAASDTYDDLVVGKGRGLVILLSGNPGCGKTLTAEAVAEVTRKPLYMISAGELGTSPEKVDPALTLALELAHRWEAVLLLDEADVFLQARNTTDLARNALVSIFLRQLEYYKGILVLTTNRVTDCDPAFESRIHVSLHYPDLEFDARKEIWKTFIMKAQKGEKNPQVMELEEIDRLAAHPLNGRQIKNLVGSARSIARESGENLDASHITTVLDVMSDWKTVRRA